LPIDSVSVKNWKNILWIALAIGLAIFLLRIVQC
jgi:hypothetical protein